MKTSIGQKSQEIAQLNPWWRDASGWSQLDGDLIQVQQSGLCYHSPVLDNLKPGCLYTLRGPRRVGKTVAVKQCIEKLTHSGVPPTAIIRIAADDWRSSDLRTLVQNIALPPLPTDTQRYWFIDEVTAISGDWARQIKWLRDNDNQFRQATVVLTGSNAVGITEAIGVLAGRRGKGVNLDRIALPLGFRTFVNLVYGKDAYPVREQLPLSSLHTASAAQAYEALLPWLDQLVSAWDLYLLNGGYPAAIADLHAGRSVNALFIQELFSVVFADAFKNSRLSEPEEMALVERLWGSMAAPFNTTEAADDLGIGADTLTRHCEYLRDAYLLWACPQVQEGSWLPRKKSQPKFYAIDPLIARLAHLRNPERADVDITVLSEMQTGMILKRRLLGEQETLVEDSQLFFLRTSSRKEIDFVSSHLAGVAVESKYIESGRWRSGASTLKASSWKGLMVTRNVLDITETDGVWAVPAGILAYLVDT